LPCLDRSVGPALTPGGLWNWKAAVLSPLCRAPLFFVINLQSGLAAAIAAFCTELIYRSIAAGVYGALTQQFTRIRNERMALCLAGVIVPAISHGVEYAVHRWAGTPRVGESVLASVVMTLATTQASLFAMRRGLFLAGPEQATLSADFRGAGHLCASIYRVGYERVRTTWAQLPR
jgi:hypothetical protein